MRFFRRRRPSSASFVRFGPGGPGSATPFKYGEHFGWLRDVSPAAWIRPLLHPFAQDVGSIIPTGFEAYGRLFHPVERRPGQRVGWSELARRNGRIAHREMQFHLINTPRGVAPPSGYHRGHGPRWGSLPLEERRVLVEYLRSATSTPEACWFCMWEGYGGLDDGGVHARVRHPGREYLLYAGVIERALEHADPLFDQSPAMWWPDDRAWFVATEIDFAWTYTGGSRRLIDALVSDPRLEVLRAELSDKITYDGDAANAALDRA